MCVCVCVIDKRFLFEKMICHVCLIRRKTMKKRYIYKKRKKEERKENVERRHLVIDRSW